MCLEQMSPFSSSSSISLFLLTLRHGKERLVRCIYPHASSPTVNGARGRRTRRRDGQCGTTNYLTHTALPGRALMSKVQDDDRWAPEPPAEVPRRRHSRSEPERHKKRRHPKGHEKKRKSEKETARSHRSRPKRSRSPVCSGSSAALPLWPEQLSRPCGEARSEGVCCPP